jgi:cephalosporin-C deacetylase-like acetyl esterase
MKGNLFLLLFALGTLCSSAIARQQALYSEQNLLDFYAYDKSAPLEAELLRTEGGTDQLDEFHLRFRSARRELVTGVFYLPKTATDSTQARCLLWLHGYGGDKSISPEALLVLGQFGFALLALDAEYHGERRQPGKDIYGLNLVENRYALAQTIIDYRRALDFLETIPQIDPQRIGLLGASMGGILGALLAGVDERVKVAIIVAGGGGWSEMVRQSQIEPAPPVREYLNGNFNVGPRLFDPVDPIHLIHRMRSPRALQIHHGDRDTIVPFSAGQALYERAGQPKDFQVYPGDDHYSIGRGSSVLRLLQSALDWLNQYL